MKMIDKLLTWGIDKAKKSKLMQNLAEKPISFEKLPELGRFVDSKNHSHILYQHLRDTIKPGASTAAIAKPIVKDNAFYVQKLKEVELEIDSIRPLIQADVCNLERIRP